MARVGIRFVDLLDETLFEAKLARNVEEKNTYLRTMLDEPALDFRAIFDTYCQLRERLTGVYRQHLALPARRDQERQESLV